MLVIVASFDDVEIEGEIRVDLMICRSVPMSEPVAAAQVEEAGCGMLVEMSRPT